MNNDIIPLKNGDFEVLYSEQVKETYKSNVMQLNTVMAKCFPELMPLLKIGDSWTTAVGMKTKVIGFRYRNCKSGKVVCYVLQSTDAHKTVMDYPCWALDKSLKDGPQPLPPLDYGHADQTAKKCIEGKDRIIIQGLNISRCYLELKKRYNKAVDLLSLQSKIIPQAESDEIEIKKLENEVGLFLGEDFNLHVINGLNNDN